ncbi:MAG: GNAT family N-acetyltransferase [Acidimicrobiales bacterium]
MSSATSAGPLGIRRSEPGDRAAILDLCRSALGWQEDDPNEAFFAWKHEENPFGASPSWVAHDDDGRILGLRVFLRWRFRDAEGNVLQAVRAVDTATHPDAQGKGIFTRLTLGALPDLRELGIDFVFNTPNDRSRPGYLKMGWMTVGRVPVGMRPGSLRSLARTARSRTGSALWSDPLDVGDPALDVLADDAGVERLLAAMPSTGIATDRDVAYLRWRYRFEPLRYRALLVGADVSDGLVILRSRTRGLAREVVVAEVLLPADRSLRSVFGDIARRSGADHLLRCGGPRMIRDGFVAAPQLGPIMTWRPIGRPGVPRMSELDLSLGDVELF